MSLSSGLGSSPPSQKALVAKVSAFLSALGFSTSAISRFIGSVGSGGGVGDLAAAFVDAVFFPSSSNVLGPCGLCHRACVEGQRRVRALASTRLAPLAESAVRALNDALLTSRGMSLSRYLHTMLVTLVNSKLAQIPATKYTLRLRWALPVGSYAGSDVLRAPRVALLRWVFKTYVDAYVPVIKGRYSLEELERELWGREYRATTVAFLRNKDADLAPVAGMLVRHAAKMNASKLSLACVVCSRRSAMCDAAASREK